MVDVAALATATRWEIEEHGASGEQDSSFVSVHLLFGCASAHTMRCSISVQTDVDAAPLPDGLRAMAEPLRWRILDLLGREEMCVSHLVEMLGAPQSLVSHHLRVLRNAGLVESDRFRYWTYYRIHPPTVEAVGQELLDLAARAPAPRASRRRCC
jgi:ArsR family transcriptional regulator